MELHGCMELGVGACLVLLPAVSAVMHGLATDR
jgi:hypothetical protein